VTVIFEKTFSVGDYVVAPFTRHVGPGDYAASVSIRRGLYDRVFRFAPHFESRDAAQRYATREGIRWLRVHSERSALNIS
jgi:hypothetical protein